MQTTTKEENIVFIRPNFWFDIENSPKKYAHIIAFLFINIKFAL